VRAERAALAGLEGGCAIPMAAWARDIDGEETKPDRPMLELDAAVFDPDGRARVAVALRGPRDDPDDLGRRAVEALRDQGAEPLLKRVT
jgi:hydroxymethylbilane synthase